MKKVIISLEDIQYAYGKLTGDNGAKDFLNKTLEDGGFDLSKVYTKYVDNTTNSLICEQENTD